MPPQRLILASASPRRRELLSQAGVDFEVRPVDIDETVRPGESPAGFVVRLAREKAAAAAANHPRAPVLAADTVVVLGDQILGKPAGPEDAARMLGLLSGRVHQVLTGFCLLEPSFSRDATDYVSTDVEFRPLSEADIRNYVDSGECLDKAGAYAIQGRGASLTRRINGSYTNVVGLPLAEVLILLRQ